MTDWHVPPSPVLWRIILYSFLIVSALLVVAMMAVTAAQAEEGGAAQKVWNFDADAANAPPTGFLFGRTGSGRPGNWVVRAESDAPSAPNVLAQIDPDETDYRFPIAVAADPVLRDVRLSVKCKPVGGKIDQACGLVLRYRDESNYYVTRANALEDNVRLYYVKAGRRTQIAGWNGKVTTGAWHQLSLEAAGGHFVVSWDGKPVIDTHDTTFTEAGKVGVWTKADSVTYFDDLTAAPLGSQP